MLFRSPVIATLANSIVNGSVGTWGQIPMPAHPDFTGEQARLAAVYILSREASEAVTDPPLNASGAPFTSTEEYDTLPRLDALHPSFQLEDIAPPGFEPKVGGLDVMSDGRLVVASWDLDGAVYTVDPNAPLARRVQRIAEGLHEPLGLKVVDDRLFVLQKQEIGRAHV